MSLGQAWDTPETRTAAPAGPPNLHRRGVSTHPQNCKERQIHFTVVRNLLNPLNLGGYFLWEFNTRLCFDMQPPCLWVRGEYIPLRGIPATADAAEPELGYNRPLPVPEPRLTKEKGTHWVDGDLNANKDTNLLAISLPPIPELPRLELPTDFPEISDPQTPS